MAGADIVTLGCRLNAYESELMRAHARDAALDDAVIVNTCAVTAEAERQARQTIRRLRRERPRARIIVTGCAAQIDPNRFAAMPEVDRVLGNAEKLRAENFRFEPDAPRVAVGDVAHIAEVERDPIEGFEGRARAFLQVQQGCDHRCTFCVIPFGRGPSRSVSAARAIAEARRLVEAGFVEIVLSGVDLTSYGVDLPGRPTLGGLAARLLAEVPGLERLRLSSLDPAAVDGDVFRLLAEEPRFMPYVHLSLQAGDDLVLKRMKRRHLRAQALDVAQRLRAARPDVVLGADLIAGFPTESDDQFANTLALIAEAGLTFLHVFPYSSRPGTPAARMAQVPASDRKVRAARLRQAGEAAAAAYLVSRVGAAIRVLVEDDNCGHDEHYAPVRLTAPSAPSRIVSARVIGCADGALIAEVSP